MSALRHFTPSPEVNAVLDHFHLSLSGLLRSHLHGMYVVGSLALGDFDPQRSDIDLIVVNDQAIDDELYQGLQEIHASFAASDFLWAARIEAVYVPKDALRSGIRDTAPYPQIERGTALFRATLEPGWVFQQYTLREYGLVVSGPDPRTLIGPIDSQEMRRAVGAIAGLWLEQARDDPDWLAWVRPRKHQVFVILTLCRMLYSLATGDVVSKPVGARWAQTELDPRWKALVAASLAQQHDPDELDQHELDDTIAFVQYVVERSRSGNPDRGCTT